MIITKFGGTSLATADNIKSACRIQLEDSNRKIMVVSAPGKRFREDVKVTDLLIDLAEKCYFDKDYEQALSLVLSRFNELIIGLGLTCGFFGQIQADLNQRLSRKDLSYERFLDLLKAAGEDNCAKITAQYLKSIGINATYLDPKETGMLLTDEAGNATVLPTAYKKLSSLKNIDSIGVHPGFFGYCSSGEVVTLGRGGSDTTGSIISAAVDASIYEIFTDVDSVFAINPALIGGKPTPIAQITYREMRELAYAGFNVLHEEAIEPVVRARIPIHIRNVFNTASAGTKILHERDVSTCPIAGIAGTDGFCILTVGKYLMNRELGFGRRLFELFENEHLSFDHAPSGIDTISPIFKQRQLSEQKQRHLTELIYTKLDADFVELTRDMAIIMLVGEGIFDSQSTLSRAINALTKAKINIEVLNVCRQSSVSLSLGVKASHLNEATTALYNEFFITN